MKVAAWYDQHRGPVVVATIPQDDSTAPEFASAPGNIPPGVRSQYLDKGSEVEWEDWAEHLTERLPHAGQWSVEDVPDGMTAHQALSEVRSRAGDRSSGAAAPA